MDINIVKVIIIIALITSGAMMLVGTYENSTQRVLRYAGVAFILIGLTITTYIILGDLPLWTITLFVSLLVIFIHGVFNTTIDE